MKTALAGLAVVCALAAVIPVRAQTAIPKRTISAVTQPLPTNAQFTLVDMPTLRDGLQKASAGQITVQLASHSERNLGGAEIVRLVRSGQVDIGAGTLSTLSGDVPLLDGVDLSGLSPDIGLARKIADAMLPIANKELERFNTKLVVLYPFPAQVLFCRQPFASLTDLKGRKVRTFGNSLVDLVQAIGGQPVSVGFPEVYSALERGVVDCAVTGTGSGAAARWPEVSSHISDLPLSWAVAGYMVNLSWWNKLDPATKALMEKTFAQMSDELWKLGDTATRDGIDCNIGKKDTCKIHQLAPKPMTEVKATETDKALVRQITQNTVLPGFVKRCGTRCGTVYNEVVAPISKIELKP
jgi:TRAP-type C4-dicarboxylate transport system substrate-binding protein